MDDTINSIDIDQHLSKLLCLNYNNNKNLWFEEFYC